MVSRRRFISALATGVAATALSAACGESSADSSTPTPQPTLTAPPPSPTAAPPTATPLPSTATPPPASLDEMIGQMLMLGFRGFSVVPGDGIFAEIAAGRVGNVVLFDVDQPSNSQSRNIQSPAQLSKLTHDLQALGSRKLLISTDEEGGLVARLKPSNGFPATLSAQELGILHDTEATRRRASDMAATLRAAGINLNLAPVVDVNVNPSNPIIGALGRSFSSDPTVVAQQALAFIAGHHSNSVLTTLKHFPGHGSSRADSHLGFVDVTETWTEAELIPYREIIKARSADAVMTAHIFNGNIDPKYPATLSKATITGVLRDQLGFDGVVITDDMMMGAIANYYAFDEAVVVAVEAGADIVAVANNGTTYDPNSARTFNAIKQAVMSGRLSENRIQDSFRRIVAMKQRLL